MGGNVDSENCVQDVLAELPIWVLNLLDKIYRNLNVNRSVKSIPSCLLIMKNVLLLLLLFLTLTTLRIVSSILHLEVVKTVPLVSSQIQTLFLSTRPIAKIAKSRNHFAQVADVKKQQRLL